MDHNADSRVIKNVSFLLLMEQRSQPINPLDKPVHPTSVIFNAMKWTLALFPQSEVFSLLEKMDPGRLN